MIKLADCTVIVPMVVMDVVLFEYGNLIVMPAGNTNFELIDENEAKIKTRHKIGKISIVQLGCRNRMCLEKFKLFNHMAVSFCVR